MSNSSRLLASLAVGIVGVATLKTPLAAAHPIPPFVGTAHVRTDSSDVAAAMQAFHAALQAGDRAAVMALLSPDAVIQESGGMEDRNQYAGPHLPGDIAFAKALPGERSTQRVVVSGNVAWSTSSSTTQGTYRDRQINSVGAEMMVLSKDVGRWRIRAIHWSSRTSRS